MSPSSPIGVFDSGLGGLSVVRQIMHDLPHERIVYFGDSANAPYGTKTVPQVRELSQAIVDFFLSRDVKAIVIACNTATSAAAQTLREQYELPIVGMEPALKVAVDRSHGTPQRIMVAATELTLREQKFAQLLERFGQHHTIIKRACPELVEIVEHDQLGDTQLVRETVQNIINDAEGSLNSIVLGCTHFVFFRDIFQELLGTETAVIDGNAGTVHHLAELLANRGMLADETQEGSIEIHNSDPTKLELSRRLLTLHN